MRTELERRLERLEIERQIENLQKRRQLLQWMIEKWKED